MYILTYSEKDGITYRIVPAENSEEKEEIVTTSLSSKSTS